MGNSAERYADRCLLCMYVSVSPVRASAVQLLTVPCLSRMRQQLDVTPRRICIYPDYELNRQHPHVLSRVVTDPYALIRAFRPILAIGLMTHTRPVVVVFFLKFCGREKFLKNDF